MDFGFDPDFICVEICEICGPSDGSRHDAPLAFGEPTTEYDSHLIWAPGPLKGEGHCLEPFERGMVLFISYSHDSDEHRERVLALSERLRDDGYDTRLDQYVNGTPKETWPRWMLDRLNEATHVLVVCTETYHRRFRGHEAPDRGFGVDWEGMLITNEIYNARSRTLKFVPVLFEPGDQQYIPEPL